MAANAGVTIRRDRRIYALRSFSDRRPSTDSERSFHAKFQVILHRLIQRRCTLEMYHRQRNNNFRKLKKLTVNKL
ncbi:unnamed protein product [Ceratitis capitata]|uniref:(Mediterranean fruit fly) hypothetical protein n=1 Tax=Ceratitis capitata TaxID=7213 RepID=A0A811UMF3_CERCA|nr:unnamed protein product [Ceratitis capitata]